MLTRVLTRYGGNSQRQGGDYEYYNDDFGYQRRSGTEIVDGEYKRGRGEMVLGECEAEYLILGLVLKFSFR